MKHILIGVKGDVSGATVLGLVKQLGTLGFEVPEACLHDGAGYVVVIGTDAGAGVAGGLIDATRRPSIAEEVLGVVRGIDEKLSAFIAYEQRDDLTQTRKRTPKAAAKKEGAADGPNKPLAPNGAQTGGAAASVPQPNTNMDPNGTTTEGGANGAANGTSTSTPVDTGTTESQTDTTPTDGQAGNDGAQETAAAGSEG